MIVSEKNKLLNLEHSLQKRVSSFSAKRPLGFGQILAPIMVQAEFAECAWSDPVIVPYAPLQFDPACKFFHYGQQIFEGMKAYLSDAGDALLFRPDRNWERMNDSARRMAMPEIPQKLFFRAVESLVHHLKSHIPTADEGTLYLRPIMLATDIGLGLKPSEKFIFLVLASPSGAYFSTQRVTAMIERQDCRAAPGGTGAFKVAGNYGASIRSGLLAQKMGFQQTLWLDAVHKSYVEEFSGMNFFAVVRGELVTPAVNDSILRGVTRDSILQLAEHQGIMANEVMLHISELISAIKDGSCTEVFACGTAAVITPVHALSEADGTTYQLPPVGDLHSESHGQNGSQNSLAMTLRQKLFAIQTGREQGPKNWVYLVNS